MNIDTRCQAALCLAIGMEVIAMADKSFVAVYPSPGPPLPCLAVVLHDDGTVSGGAARTIAEAQKMAEVLAAELHLAIATGRKLDV